MLPTNLDRVLVLGFSFQFIFTAFFCAQNLSAQVMINDGFDGLGFYTTATLYLAFSVGSFFGSAVVNKTGIKAGLIIGSMSYIFWVMCFIAPALKFENPDSDLFFLSSSFITFISLFSAAINGLGGGMLWVANSKYLIGCSTDSNKGLLFSIFFSLYMTA